MLHKIIYRLAIVLFAQTPFDKVLGVSNLDWLRYEIIWEKTNATGHTLSKGVCANKTIAEFGLVIRL
jgi:hypothetical protein